MRSRSTQILALAVSAVALAGVAACFQEDHGLSDYTSRAGSDTPDVNATNRATPQAERVAGRPGAAKAPGSAMAHAETIFHGAAGRGFRQHTFASVGGDFDAALTKDGTRLVFASTRHSKYSRLYIKDVDGASVTELTDGPAHDVQPAVDPKGRCVAFASDRSGNWDIWVVGLDGRNPMQITNDPLPELHPSWSPDGSRLVYCRADPEHARGELWIAEMAKPGVRRFIGGGMFPAWAPNSDTIAFQRPRKRGSRLFSLWTLELVNDEPMYPTEIVSSPDEALIAPAWSPDGMRLAFAAIQPGSGPRGRDGSRVCVVGADGRGRRYITEPRGENYSPVWSSDGRIYFTARLSGTETIWSVLPSHPAGPAQITRTARSDSAVPPVQTVVPVGTMTEEGS